MCCILILFLILSFTINYKNLFSLLSAGILGGIAEVAYIESQIRKSNLLRIIAFIFLVLSAYCFITFDFDFVLLREDTKVFLILVSAILVGVLYMDILIIGYFGIFSLYIKFVRRDILNQEFKLLPYSILFG